MRRRSRIVEGIIMHMWGVGSDGAEGEYCTFGNNLTTGGNDGESLTVTISWHNSASGPGREECRTPGRYTFAVLFDSAQDNTASIAEDQAEQVPLEIQVGLEPPATDPGPAPADQPVGYAAPPGPAQPIVGGGSFGTAATLPGTGQYAEVLQFGEVLYYRVRVDWGQGLAYRVEYGPTDFGPAESTSIWSTLYTPGRGKAAWGTAALGYWGKEVSIPEGNGAAITTRPIRYRNRELKAPDGHQSVAGWYYISVKLGRTNRPHTPVSVTLKVSLAGTAEPGPQYQDATAGKDAFGGQRTAAPPSPSAEPSTSAGPMSARRTSDDGSAPLWYVGTGLALAVLAAAAVGTLLVLRRRRAAPADRWQRP